MTAGRRSCASTYLGDDAGDASEERFIERWHTLTEACELLARLETEARAVQDRKRVRRRGGERAR